MKIFLLSQAGSIGLFHSLGKTLCDQNAAEDIGYYVSEEKYYDEFLKRVPDFESNTSEIIKSWELLNTASTTPTNMDALKRWESELPGETLWDAIVSDRRIVYGNKFDFRLDYETRFTHERALAYLSQSLQAFDEAFSRFQPDLVVGFVCSTLSEYVAYLVARSKGIPYLNLRPSRVDNFMGIGPTPNEPSEYVAEQFANYMSGDRDEWWEKAVSYLQSSRGTGTKYEGVITASRKTAASSSESVRFFGLAKLANITGIIRAEISSRRSIPIGDRGMPGMVLPALYKRVFNPLLARKIHRQLDKRYVSPNDLKDQPFAFFPLHMEPEVTLLRYSRSYLNQIEVVRNVAYNLPVGMKLVVKEHPVALGKRKPGYYKKLLQIMNVEIADPAYSANDFIERCSLITNIAGSVGFEAAIAKKPALTFGHTPYEILPESMIKRVENINIIHSEILELLNSHRHDEDALTAFVAAVMNTSIPVNWYTNLLGRSAYSSQTNTYQEDIDTLADGLIGIYNERIQQNTA